MAASPQTQVRKRAAKRSAWKALMTHYKAVSKLHLRQLFADDPERGQRMTVDALGLYLDVSEHVIQENHQLVPDGLAEIMQKSLGQYDRSVAAVRQLQDQLRREASFPTTPQLRAAGT